MPVRNARFFRRHRRLTLFLVIVVGIVVIDVAFTTAARATGLYTPPLLRDAAYRIPHPVYHHDLAPNADRAIAYWGPIQYTVSTNSLGFKDEKPRQVGLRPEKQRTLLIGDSFTEGIGVPYEKTFAGILAREMKERGVEVLNAGASSYSPAIYLRKVRHLIEKVGLEFDRLVVCIDPSDILDELRLRVDDDGRIVEPPLGIDGFLKARIDENTVLLRHIRVLWRRVRFWAEGQPTDSHGALNKKNALWTSDPVLMEAEGREGLRRAAANMTALRELCRRHDIAMAVVVYPWPDHIWRKESDCILRTFWLNWAKTNDVQFVDCFPAFLEAGSPEEVLETFFIPGDFHWNDEGHRLMAKVLLEQLTF